ncbi:aminotransferase class V-fold PLP-dependent enzyme [Sphingomonas montanisoli]|uniref:Aminotransferase class V-fold PLP-dependent enzyme n=1 Tax=Sphingomonas montanisoli TaxID=2606412 RepID=A0A5D9CGW2_9SPHN|nr:aminotransferase class V-fold PLP-dependent enzyme [Sphingomonas montanisoli]TZG29351.1 aminotransferase class V-fold PLP-dependent enzyme [Sphingomonas montanisoli]
MNETAPLSRRALLQSAVVASLAVPAIAGAAGRSSFREKLLLDPGVRYFNAANIGPAFRAVIEVQEAELRAFQANPSREYREKYPVAADALRARLAKRLNVTGAEIALLRNASEANTVAVLGLDLKPGDEIIVTEHNHQSTLDSWKLRAKREGLVIKVLPTPATARNPQVVADAFAAAITPRTRAIFLSHMTNVTGLVYPVATIAQVARAKGVWLHVDGAQTFGWMPIDLMALGVDSYATSTHKWMMGPLESGILYVRREGQDRLNPTMISHGYWLNGPRDMETAERYEVLGQRDDPKLIAIDRTLDLLDGMGEAAIEAGARQGATRMRDLLAKAPGAKFVGSDHPALSGPVLTFAFPGQDVGALRARLWRDGKVATAQALADGQLLVRFSPHLYNDADEMQAVVDLLR